MSAHVDTPVMAVPAEATAPAAPSAPPDVRASKLLAVLGLGGVVAGALLVIVYGLTLPAIEENRARVLRLAVTEVLKGPARYDTLYVTGGRLVTKPPDGVDPKTLEQVYVGYDANDRPVGVAALAGEPGFQDVITLIVGYDPATKKLLGMKVLESKETPGLGDKIEKDEKFVAQFSQAPLPLTGVKKGKGGKPGDIDMITGATISSRAVIRIINRKLERLRPLVEAYAEGTRR